MPTTTTEHTPERTLPRDEFTARLRELTANPGAVHTQSRLDIDDFYGLRVTWNIDTFQLPGGNKIAFLQRLDVDGSLRLVLPAPVMQALTRHHETLSTKRRQQSARAAVETRRARGDQLGNPDALKKARAERKAKR
jgi:hypothetical protein